MADPDDTPETDIDRAALIMARESELSAYNIDDVHELGKYVI